MKYAPTLAALIGSCLALVGLSLHLEQLGARARTSAAFTTTESREKKRRADRAHVVRVVVFRFVDPDALP